MDLVFLVFSATYLGVLIYAIINLAKTKNVSVELPPTALQRYARHSATKLRVFGRVLKITLLNITTLLILLCIAVSSLIAATAYSDKRTEFIQAIEESVQAPIALIKLSKPVSKHDAVTSLYHVIERSESVSYLYRATLERGIFVDSLPGVKWVVIGVDGDLRSKLNISEKEILTGCQTPSEVAHYSSRFKVTCIQDSTFRFKITPLETLLPVLGYIGMEPITPSLDLVIISDVETIAEILSLGDTLVTDVLFVGKDIDRNVVESVLEVLNVDTLQYFFNTTALILGSVRVMTLEAAISTLFVVMSCAIVVAVAYRSLLPEFKTINERLHYIGLPPWGTTITLLMHVAVAVSLGALASSTLASFLFTARQAIISTTVSLFSGLLAALTLVRELSTGTTSYGAYTPTVERHEIVFPTIKIGNLGELVNMVREAIETNEFFELEEFEYRSWEKEVVVYCRVNFKEMWGVILSGLIAVTPLDSNMVKVFLETDVSSIEEISESINNSIRALFVSKVIGKLKTLL
ncbi:MAG: hypothetical protein QW154_03685 [Sulfolobales archaeon]